MRSRLSTSVRFLSAACATALLSACAVGPGAPEATFPLPASGAFIGQGLTPQVSPAEARSDWWRLYNDPVLDRLVAQALAENNELEAAAANLRLVRASLSETRSARLPSSSLSGAAQRGRQAAYATPGAGPVSPDDSGAITETYDVGLDMAYEIDLFGRVSSAIRAARADADAAQAALEVVQITVAAETARAYADACSANARIAVTERSIGLQQETADLTQRLLDMGRGTGLDTARADSALQSTRATLPPLRAQRDAALFRLSTLTGVTPAEASQAARDCARPPQLTRPIPIGDGAALLARRPDVRRAERELASAAARVNVAVASLYPTIQLGGSLGATAFDASDLGDDAALRFNVGPLISWSFPNIAATRARIAQAEAGTDVALANFDQTVLVALQETETALSAYANELDRRAALTTARDRAADAERLSRLRFDAGADSFLTLLDAQRTLAQADAALAASEAQVSNNQITLFKALAGGWGVPE